MVRIEKIKIRDYDEMARLWETAGLPTRPDGRDSCRAIASQLRSGNSIYLKAVSKGRMVAVVLGTHDGRKGWINRLAVAPSERRKGIGKALVDDLERRFEKLGIHIYCCQIEDWNKVSFRVFRKLGYVIHRDILYLSKRKTDAT